jgi:hypothetical protein
MKIAVVIPVFAYVPISSMLPRMGPMAIECTLSTTNVPSDRRSRRERDRFARAGPASPEESGVGGAVVTGYREALAEGMNVVVKIDGDGRWIRLYCAFRSPVVSNADYTERSHSYRSTKPCGVDWSATPPCRSCPALGGYWDILIPERVRRFTAAYRRIAIRKISTLFLRVGHAVQAGHAGQEFWIFPCAPCGSEKAVSTSVMPPPIRFRTSATSASGSSGLFPAQLLLRLDRADCRNLSAHVWRIFGSVKWIGSASTSVTASAGTVMIAGVSIILGLQLLLAFLSFDMNSTPRDAVSRSLASDGDIEEAALPKQQPKLAERGSTSAAASHNRAQYTTNDLPSH